MIPWCHLLLLLSAAHTPEEAVGGALLLTACPGCSPCSPLCFPRLLLLLLARRRRPWTRPCARNGDEVHPREISLILSERELDGQVGIGTERAVHLLRQRVIIVVVVSGTSSSPFPSPSSVLLSSPSIATTALPRRGRHELVNLLQVRAPARGTAGPDRSRRQIPESAAGPSPTAAEASEFEVSERSSKRGFSARTHLDLTPWSPAPFFIMWCAGEEHLAALSGEADSRRPRRHLFRRERIHAAHPRGAERVEGQIPRPLLYCLHEAHHLLLKLLRCL
mmetsp:Transcript_13073/g.31694  ORF Transcript_13073/g.31694 Transcript_13073/m.31694 type:complete len:278 (-) Transcript_13073:361-1194(-)